MIKRNIRNIFLKFAILFNKFANKLNLPPPPNIQAVRCAPWFADNGDRTLRLDYDLSAESIVFDLGGYEGQWASDIFSKYVCSIYLFEPYTKYVDEIKKRFSRNPKIKIFNFGLSKCDESLDLNISADGSSVFKGSGEKSQIHLKDAIYFFETNGITHIDLLKINIEGGEYDFLERIIEDKIINNISNIQVQFHDFAPNAVSRMKAIQAKLSETHYTTYSYEFVWENWTLKK